MSEDEKVIETALNANSQNDEKVEITAEIAAGDLNEKTLEIEWAAPFADCDFQDNDFILVKPKIKNVGNHKDVYNADAIEYFDDYRNSNGIIPNFGKRGPYVFSLHESLEIQRKTLISKMNMLG